MSEQDITEQVEQFYSIDPDPKGTPEEVAAPTGTPEEEAPDEVLEEVVSEEVAVEAEPEPDAQKAEPDAQEDKAVVEEPAKPDETEALKEKAKFYQTRHQETVKRLKDKYGPEFYAQLMAEPQDNPITEPGPDADEREWMRHEARVAYREERRLEREQERAQQYQQLLVAETNGANAAIAQLEAIALEAGISQEQVNSAFAAVNNYNFNTKQLGQPRGYALAFADKIETMLDRQYATNPSARIKETVQAKMEAAKKIAQPSGAPTGLAPKRKLTAEEQELIEMASVDDNPKIDEFFKIKK